MKISVCFIAAGLLGSVIASTNSTLDALVAKSSANMKKILHARTLSNSTNSTTCYSKNVLVRREWTTLLSEEKTEYIDAVKCLMSKDPITPAAAAPGVRSRFDDFAALHVNKTSMIHWTTYFYSWHRHYTHLYETALRDECNYTGTQPYWDWSSTTTVAAHPLFDGSATSMGGNGIPTNHTSVVYLPTPDVINSTLTSGSGGGCITTGPFSNFTVTLGPHGAPLTDGLVSNPRCLTRDFRD